MREEYSSYIIMQWDGESILPIRRGFSCLLLHCLECHEPRALRSVKNPFTTCLKIFKCAFFCSPLAELPSRYLPCLASEKVSYMFSTTTINSSLQSKHANHSSHSCSYKNNSHQPILGCRHGCTTWRSDRRGCRVSTEYDLTSLRSRCGRG